MVSALDTFCLEDMISNKLRFQNNEVIRERIVIAVRWICMALFVYTAYAKIIDHDRFLKGLTRVHLISSISVLLSYIVPILEIIISVLLLIPKTAIIGLHCFIAVMGGFTFYIIAAMIWENNLPCHCGGAIEKLSWSQHIWFNVAFIALAITAVRAFNKNTSFKNIKS